MKQLTMISKAAISKFTHRLWYLSEEIAVLSLFDNEVDKQTKPNVVANLQLESLNGENIWYVSSKEEMPLSSFV